MDCHYATRVLAGSGWGVSLKRYSASLTLVYENGPFLLQARRPARRGRDPLPVRPGVVSDGRVAVARHLHHEARLPALPARRKRPGAAGVRPHRQRRVADAVDRVGGVLFHGRYITDDAHRPIE